MVRCRELRNLVLKLFREKGIEASDALYLWSLASDTNGERCFALRYGSTNIYRESLEHLYRLCGRRNVLPNDRTADGPRVGKCIISSFEKNLAKLLEPRIIEKSKKLSVQAKCIAYLLYIEDSIPKNRYLLLIDTTLFQLLRVPYKLTMNNEISEEGLNKLIDELIASGLLVEVINVTKRHVYRKYISPAYAINVWKALPKIINFETKCEVTY